MSQIMRERPSAAARESGRPCVGLLPGGTWTGRGERFRPRQGQASRTLIGA